VLTSVTLPYSPQLYARNSVNVTTTANVNQLIGHNDRRVMLWITVVPPIAAANPQYLLEQVGNGSSVINVSSPAELFLHWDHYYILTCCSVFSSGFNIGSVFNVTEITWNPLSSSETNHDRRINETLKSRLQSAVRRQSGDRRYSVYPHTGK